MTNNQQPTIEQDEPFIGEFEDEDGFIPCSKCDGHPACEDFGCAIKAGLIHLVHKDITDL